MGGQKRNRERFKEKKCHPKNPKNKAKKPHYGGE